jgi:hypothetical protein
MNEVQNNQQLIQLSYETKVNVGPVQLIIHLIPRFIFTLAVCLVSYPILPPGIALVLCFFVSHIVWPGIALVVCFVVKLMVWLVAELATVVGVEMSLG